MAKDLENTMVDNNVYILTGIDAETTNGLIIQLTQWVNKIPFVKKGDLFYKEQKIIPAKDSSVRIITAKEAQNKIYGPHEEIPEHIPTLNVWINSNGGNQFQLLSMLSIFNIASAKGTIIRTYNIGHADSSASMIAISGTHGYRFMAEDAFNMIHYGLSRGSINHPNEVEGVMQDFARSINVTSGIYTTKTNLSKKELSKYQNIEGSGRLNSMQCLEKGICDWVITNDGRFVNNVNELKQNQR